MHKNRECAEWRAVPGAVIYSTCNDVDLNVISKHVNVHHFLGYKFKAVVGNNEDVNLVNMGVSIQLDSSIGMVKSLASPPRKYLKKPIITNATSLTWPVVPLKANKKQAFKIQVKAKRGTPDKKLVFTVSTFQTFVSPSGDKENVCCKYSRPIFLGFHPHLIAPILLYSPIPASSTRQYENTCGKLLTKSKNVR